MTYIDLLNDFNQWLESNALPCSSQLMYFRLLNVFNRAGWPEYVQVDNLRMMIMTGVESTHAIVRARDKLVEAGFITFQKGKKGCPNRYYLKKQCKNVTVSVTENVTKSDTVSVTENVTTNVTHIKTKTKTKTKNNTPISPSEDSIPYADIVDILNEAAGTSYRASSQKTRTCIHARWDDGFRVEDFRTVIRKKSSQWLGTDMEKYLRPETLFGPKFEGYLNEGSRIPQARRELDSGETEAIRRMMEEDL